MAEGLEKKAARVLDMQRAVSGRTATSRNRAPREHRDDVDLPAVVRAAADGDALAWQTLVQRFTNMVLAVARSCGLSDADVAEVHQVTWLRMVENINRIEHPERIAAWLVTTSKRESLRVARARRRVSLDHDAMLQYPDLSAKPVDDGPIAEERAAT
ncbi:MAG: RNA polymerase sigma factor, partial [Acidimicrobiales bacterium]